MLSGVYLGEMRNSAKVAFYCCVSCVSVVGAFVYEIFTGTLYPRSVASQLAGYPYNPLILCLNKALLFICCGSCHGAVAVCDIPVGCVCGVNTETVLK